MKRYMNKLNYVIQYLQRVLRIADMSEEIHRLRPPRFIRRDGVVTPFTYFEAEGNEVLQV